MIPKEWAAGENGNIKFHQARSDTKKSFHLHAMHFALEMFEKNIFVCFYNLCLRSPVTKIIILFIHIWFCAI